MMTSLHVEIIGFDIVNELYCDNDDFGDIWKACEQRLFKDFVIVDGFLFKGTLLAIPVCSLCLSIIDELHARNLSEHFGRNKTLALV